MSNVISAIRESSYVRAMAWAGNGIATRVREVGAEVVKVTDFIASEPALQVQGVVTTVVAVAGELPELSLAARRPSAASCSSPALQPPAPLL